jgi:GNAT superfamily N-acetyltransferase
VDPEETGDIQDPSVRPLPDGSDIRKVAEADVPRVAKALAAGFYDDPLIGHWVFPDASRRMRRLQRGFELYVRRIWLRHDECYTTDRVIGGAMWMPPGTWHLTILQQLRLLPPMAVAMGGSLPRLLRVLNAFEAKHPHDSHFYLPAIGVEPEWQGRGFGAALMRPILERCDRERVPAYLEATSPQNRALYERHGFEVVEEMTVKDSPPFWRMWRDPRASNA